MPHDVVRRRAGALRSALSVAMLVSALPVTASIEEATPPSQPPAAVTAPAPGVVVAPTTPAPAPVMPAPRILTLDEAIAIALERNRTLQIATEQVQRALGQLGEARAPARLQATAQASATRVDRRTTITLPGPQGEQTITTGNLYNRTASVQLTQPIDISGALRAARGFAEANLQFTELDVERTREQTVLDVSDAFYAVLRARSGLEVALADRASLEEFLRQVQVRFEVGTVPRFDVLRAEAQVANAQQNVIATRNAVELAQASLNNIMGIPVITPLELVPDKTVAVLHPNYAESVARAVENRPEVQQARVRIEQAEESVTVARKNGRPSLSLSGNLDYNFDTSAFDSRKTSWNATLAISYPLLDGGLTKSRVQQAEADVAIAQISQSQTLSDVSLEVQQSILSINEAAERLQAATANVASAAEARRLAGLRYREGLATALEVTDAQAALTQARSNQVNAQYDLLLAEARYRRAIGARYGAAAPTAPTATPEAQPAAPATSTTSETPASTTAQPAEAPVVITTPEGEPAAPPAPPALGK